MCMHVQLLTGNISGVFTFQNKNGLCMLKKDQPCIESQRKVTFKKKITPMGGQRSSINIKTTNVENFEHQAMK